MHHEFSHTVVHIICSWAEVFFKPGKSCKKAMSVVPFLNKKVLTYLMVITCVLYYEVHFK